MNSPLAGEPAPQDLLINVPRLVSAYYTYKPDPDNEGERVSFGTSGHRGSSLTRSFNEDHILAVCAALCEYRANEGITGPLFVGMDTHALSEAARATAVEVFAADGLTVMLQEGLGYTPTPVVSHAILTYNRGRKDGFADGVVITPSPQPARGRRLQVQPAQRRPRGHEHDELGPKPGQRDSERGRGEGGAPSFRARAGGRDDAPVRFCDALRGGLGERHRHGRRRGRGIENWCGPDGRGGHRVLGAHRRALRA